jgi:hypothetical protein
MDGEPTRWRRRPGPSGACRLVSLGGRWGLSLPETGRCHPLEAVLHEAFPAATGWSSDAIG